MTFILCVVLLAFVLPIAFAIRAEWRREGARRPDPTRTWSRESLAARYRDLEARERADTVVLGSLVLAAFGLAGATQLPAFPEWVLRWAPWFSDELGIVAFLALTLGGGVFVAERWEVHVRALALFCPSCGGLLAGGRHNRYQREVSRSGRCPHCKGALFDVARR